MLAIKINNMIFSDPGGLISFRNDNLELVLTTVTSNKSVTIPHLNGYNYNYTVKWGDGTASSTVTTYNSANCTHVYTTAGTYTISIKGLCESLYFISITGTTLRNLLTSVSNWGMLV